MNLFARGLVKLVVSYLAVIFVILLLPAFLIAKNISEFDGVMNYLFDNPA